MNNVEDIVPLSFQSTHCSSVVLPNLTCCQIAHNEERSPRLLPIPHMDASKRALPHVSKTRKTCSLFWSFNICDLTRWAFVIHGWARPWPFSACSSYSLSPWPSVAADVRCPPPDPTGRTTGNQYAARYEVECHLLYSDMRFPPRYTLLSL